MACGFEQGLSIQHVVVILDPPIVKGAQKNREVIIIFLHFLSSEDPGFFENHILFSW